MTWKSDIVNRLPVTWLVLFVGISIVGYFGVRFYEKYVELKITEIVYASASKPEVEKTGEGIKMGEAGRVEGERIIKTASSTY